MTYRNKAAAAALAATALVGATKLAHAQCGGASWYALTSKTASGERMNPAAMTAAHRTLPFGTHVTVRNQRNGRAVRLKINDRGPFIRGRVIDVSKAAAVQLGFVSAGHTKICIEKS